MTTRQQVLTTTAMTAVFLFAEQTAAADGVKLSLGGRYKGTAGVVFDDFSASSGVSDDDVRNYVFKQDVEIYFRGETTLDNGLTVGAQIELEGQTSGDQIDAVYAYFSGGFGQLRIGDTYEAYAQLCSLVPSASELFGADSPDFNFSNAGIAGYAATNGTCYGVDDNSTKLVYFSPTFGGFSFAASFTPDNTEDTRNTVSGAGTRFTNNAGENSENLSLAAAFNHDFNDVSLSLGGGATFSFDKEVNPSGTDDARGYNAYFRVGFGGFTIGGATELRQNFGTDGSDQWVFGAGATYAWDSWTVGLGWTRGDYEKIVGANGVGPFNAVHDDFALTASYALGPGINVDGVVELSDYQSNNAAGPDYRGIAFGLGTYISF
jgi:hypothetical protein